MTGAQVNYLAYTYTMEYYTGRKQTNKQKSTADTNYNINLTDIQLSEKSRNQSMHTA